jgi:hypothetical protein
MSQGAIQRGPLGFAAPAVVTMCRLLDSAELRGAIATGTSSDIAVIVTDDLFRDVIGRGYGGLPAADFSPVIVNIPHKGNGFSARAWLQVPGPQPLLAQVPQYREPASLSSVRGKIAGGLVGLGGATALAWALFSGPGDPAATDVHGQAGHPDGDHLTGDGASGEPGDGDHGSADDDTVGHGAVVADWSGPEGDSGHWLADGIHPVSSFAHDIGQEYNGSADYGTGSGDETGSGYDDGNGYDDGTGYDGDAGSPTS